MINRITQPIPFAVAPVVPKDQEQNPNKNPMETSIFSRAQKSDKQHEQKQQLYTDPNGKVATKEEAFNVFINKIGTDIQQRGNAVIKHEQAHQAAAKGLGSSPTYIEAKYENDPLNRSFITSGFVNIAVPHKIDPTATMKQIEQTKRNAETVIKAAEAPSSFSELSGADINVAAKGEAVLSSAKVAGQLRKELEAKLAINNPDKNPENLTPEQLAKAENPQGKPQKPVVGAKFDLFV